MQVHLQNLQVTFVSQGHWVKVKVKVTGAKCLLGIAYQLVSGRAVWTVFVGGLPAVSYTHLTLPTIYSV